VASLTEHLRPSSGAYKNPAHNDLLCANPKPLPGLAAAIQLNSTMENLSLEQVADLLETATIEQTHDLGHAVVHTGASEAGMRFVLVNDIHGDAVVSYAL